MSICFLKGSLSYRRNDTDALWCITLAFKFSCHNCLFKVNKPSHLTSPDRRNQFSRTQCTLQQNSNGTINDEREISIFPRNWMNRTPTNS